MAGMQNTPRPVEFHPSGEGKGLTTCSKHPKGGGGVQSLNITYTKKGRVVVEGVEFIIN